MARGYDGFLYSIGLKDSVSPFRDWVFDFLTFFILFSYFVPMSLYVVFEFSRTIQAFFMDVCVLSILKHRMTLICM